jgi:tRNA pseudouridine55 synthase
VDGILIIDKPERMTSHDVVARVRRILGTKRVGHTGTLDPFATGVMVLLVGKATRLAQFLDKDEKEYEAVIRFGFETDTGDRTGRPNAECGVRSAEFDSADHDWETVFSSFRGELMQTPPMYSAKKVEGKKLYELARKGIEIPRQAVPVFISKLEILPNESRPMHSELRIRVVCSAGTYIRTLAEDIGRAVGAGAHLTELRRTRAGRFGIDRAATLDQLEAANDPSDELIPITEAVSHLPEIVLTAERAARTRDGLLTRVDDGTYDDGGAVRMLDEDRDIIAIGIYNGDEKTVKPKIVLG